MKESSTRRKQEKFALRVGFPLIDQMIMFTHTESEASWGAKWNKRIKEEKNNVTRTIRV